MRKSIYDQLIVFEDINDVSRWHSAWRPPSGSILPSVEEIVSCGNAYIKSQTASRIKALSEEYDLPQLTVTSKLQSFVLKDNPLKNLGIGAGLGAGLAMLASGPVGWFALGGAAVGSTLSRRNNINKAFRLLLTNAQEIANHYTDIICSHISGEAPSQPLLPDISEEVNNEPRASIIIENSDCPLFVSEQPILVEETTQSETDTTPQKTSIEVQNAASLYSNTKQDQLLSIFDSIISHNEGTNAKFEGFVHTTDYENFENIIKYGFLTSRVEAVHHGLIKRDDALKEVIDNTDINVQEKTRFYYYYNTPTNYQATYNNPVILVFDKALMYDEDKAYYCEQNAGKRSSKPTQNVDEALNFNWTAIFERGKHSSSVLHNACLLEVSPEEKAEILAYRNAEFLYDGRVEIDRIVKVYFKSVAMRRAAEILCYQYDRSDLIKKFSDDYSPWRFANKNDKIH